jgi:hypothetical protein
MPVSKVLFAFENTTRRRRLRALRLSTHRLKVPLHACIFACMRIVQMAEIEVIDVAEYALQGVRNCRTILFTCAMYCRPESSGHVRVLCQVMVRDALMVHVRRSASVVSMSKVDCLVLSKIDFFRREWFSHVLLVAWLFVLCRCYLLIAQPQIGLHFWSVWQHVSCHMVHGFLVHV